MWWREPRCAGEWRPERRRGAWAVSLLLFVSQPSYWVVSPPMATPFFFPLLSSPSLVSSFPSLFSFLSAQCFWTSCRGRVAIVLVSVLGNSDYSCFICLSCLGGAIAWDVTNHGFVSISPPFPTRPPCSAVPPCVVSHPLLNRSSGKAHQSLRLPNTPHQRRSSRSRSSAYLMTPLSLRSA